MKNNKEYFNIETYINHYNTTFKKKSKSKIIVVNAVRNIGKSYSTWKYAEKYSLTPKKKLVYMRNQEEQIKFVVKDFNNMFHNKFLATSTHIYKLEKSIIEKGEEQIAIYKKGEVVGYMISLSTYYKYKSGEFNDVNLLFFDEYNQREAYKQFENFISLGKTIERFSQMEMIFLGNRESANNEFMVKFGIDPISPEDKDGDIMIPIKNINNPKEIIGAFFEIGNKTYENLGNKNMLIDKIAAFSNTTNNYMLGEYLEDYSLYIINFRKHIEKTFIPKFCFVISKIIYTFGKFQNKKFAVVRQDNYFDEGLKKYSFDSFSDQMEESLIIEDDDKNELMELLFMKVKKNIIYYDSFDTKKEVELCLIQLKHINKWYN